MLGKEVKFEQRALIAEIMRLGLLVNDKTEHTVFVKFLGHVKWVEIDFNEKSWDNPDFPPETYHIRLVGSWSHDKDLNEQYEDWEIDEFLEVARNIKEKFEIILRDLD